LLSARKFIVRLFRFKRNLRVVAVTFTDRNRRLDIQVKPFKNGCRCPECGRRCKIVNHTRYPRYWKDLPVHGIEVFLCYAPKEVLCPTHGRIQEEIPWADPYARVSYRFEYALLRFCQAMTQKAACELLKTPKSTLSGILHAVIQRERAGHKIRNLREIGVDELSYAKGHKYVTLVYDLKKAKVVWVGRGKKKTTLRRFFESLSQYQRNQIRYACCDMAEGFIVEIKHWLKKATLVIDRFHIVKALNTAMDEVRKEEWREVSKKEKKALKGVRWLLFRHSKTRSKRDSRTINKLRRANNRIYRAWLLKDEFEHFWEYAYPGSAEKFLKRWMTRALKSRLEPIRRFVRTVREYQEHILPYIETGLTNAKAEGINRIIGIVKNRASGFETCQALTDMIYLTVGDLDIPAQIPARFHTI
jgi:transposase